MRRSFAQGYALSVIYTKLGDPRFNETQFGFAGRCRGASFVQSSRQRLTVQTISTYLSYKQLAGDLTKTLSRVASEAQIKRDAAYYNDNIGKVKSLDDFMKNTRLYSYAMKAYGLEDMTYAKAFMRKVFQSDLNDSKSFVRQLTDPRFLQIAKAFNFATDGKINKSPATAQETNDLNDTVGLYSGHRVKQGTAAAADAAFYQSAIGSVTTVDDLLSRPRLLNIALQAYGLDPNLISNDTLKAVLTSDLSDPNSYANQLTNPAYKAFAAAFSFQSDGTVAAGGSAQTDAQVQSTIFAYYDASGNGSSPAAAAFKSQYYKDTISTVTSVDDFLANDHLLDYALTAVGLDPAIQSKARLRLVLTSDLSDPNSAANQQISQAYRTLTAAFNFAADGSINGTEAQSSDQLQTMVDGFSTAYDDSATTSEATETAYYKRVIAGVGTVSDLLKDKRLYAYVLTAFGLDPDTELKSKITQVLESDVTNPSSFVNSTHDSRYVALASAFNFGADGKAQTASAAQMNSALVSTIQLYNTASSDPSAKQTATKNEDVYYSDTIGTIQSVDDLLKDKRLVAYVQKAFGLDAKTATNDVLRKAMISDPMDPKSYVNQKGNTQYRALATAFNFDAAGKIATVPKLQAQDRGDLVATSDLYLRQSLEQEAGGDNEGVRLALYFQRIAPTVASPYGILADKALLQVTQTALGLPATMSNADIDVQANMISKKLNIADLKDPKKLEKLIARFSALYDLNNSGYNAATVAVQLFAR